MSNNSFLHDINVAYKLYKGVASALTFGRLLTADTLGLFGSYESRNRHCVEQAALNAVLSRLYPLDERFTDFVRRNWYEEWSTGLFSGCRKTHEMVRHALVLTSYHLEIVPAKTALFDNSKIIYLLAEAPKDRKSREFWRDITSSFIWETCPNEEHNFKDRAKAMMIQERQEYFTTMEFPNAELSEGIWWMDTVFPHANRYKKSLTKFKEGLTWTFTEYEISEVYKTFESEALLAVRDHLNRKYNMKLSSAVLLRMHLYKRTTIPAAFEAIEREIPGVSKRRKMKIYNYCRSMLVLSGFSVQTHNIKSVKVEPLIPPELSYAYVSDAKIHEVVETKSHIVAGCNSSLNPVLSQLNQILRGITPEESRKLSLEELRNQYTLEDRKCIATTRTKMPHALEVTMVTAYRKKALPKKMSKKDKKIFLRKQRFEKTLPSALSRSNSLKFFKEQAGPFKEETKLILPTKEAFELIYHTNSRKILKNRNIKLKASSRRRIVERLQWDTVTPLCSSETTRQFVFLKNSSVVPPKKLRRVRPYFTPLEVLSIVRAHNEELSRSSAVT